MARSYGVITDVDFFDILVFYFPDALLSEERVNIAVNIFEKGAHAHDCIAPIDKEIALYAETAFRKRANDSINERDFFLWVHSIICHQIQECIVILCLFIAASL